MAMQDYFINCYKLETKTISDGLGGYEVVEYEGISFKGLPVKKSETEQLVGALRGNEKIQYVFHTTISIPLNKDDKIAYIDEQNKTNYIRLSSDAILNTEQSGQTDWKSYEAESYIPTSIVKEKK